MVTKTYTNMNELHTHTHTHVIFKNIENARENYAQKYIS